MINMSLFSTIILFEIKLFLMIQWDVVKYIDKFNSTELEREKTGKIFVVQSNNKWMTGFRNEHLCLIACLSNENKKSRREANPERLSLSLNSIYYYWWQELFLHSLITLIQYLVSSEKGFNHLIRDMWINQQHEQR